MSRDCAIRDKAFGVALESKSPGEGLPEEAGASDDFSDSPLADAEFSGEGLLTAGAFDRVEEDDPCFGWGEVSAGIHSSLHESWHTSWMNANDWSTATRWLAGKMLI